MATTEASLLRALGHPFRLRIVEALGAEEACVCHLSAYFRRPQPYISKHLAELRDAGVLIDRREGQRIFYHLADPAYLAIVEATRVAVRGQGTEPADAEPAALYPVVGCECPRCSGGNGLAD